ncbi:BTB/POZ protein [Xylaria palmicola]|nr:BTB/POZ protein [Xylaria palmicola]
MGRLLKTGLFSDVRVTCGEKEWKLHKAVICTRCEYFKAAFTGTFNEASTGEMAIHEQEPHKVEWLITCIYTGKAAPELAEQLKDRGTLPSAVAEVMEVADFFCYSGLEDLLAGYLRPHLLENAEVLQQHFPKKPGGKWDRDCSDTILADFIDPFFKVAETIYVRRKPSAKLHQTFMEFFSMTRFGLLDDDPHRERFEKIPILSASVFTLFMAEQYGKHWTSPPHEVLPAECDNCHDHCAAEEDPDEEQPRLFRELWYDGRGEIRGRCKYCTRRR